MNFNEDEVVQKLKQYKKPVLFCVALILLWMLSPFVVIGAGERGVVLQFGAVEDGVLGEGIHFRVPIMQQVKLMDVRTVKHEAKVSAYSRDLQTVDSVIALNYHVAPDAANKLWQEVGRDYETRLIDPAIQESVKAAAAQFTAAELVEKRPLVKDEIKRILSERLGPRHLVVDDFSIVHFDFADSYEKAIEAKQVAQQEALKAENDLRRIEVEAKQKIETAKADAETIRIQAQAITQQGGPEYVQLQAIKKWTGEVPQYMMGSSVPFINLDFAKK